MSSPNALSVLPAQVDVLVVGAGAAGLYTALSLPTDATIGLVTKDTLSRSASDWAQGGIAAVIDPQDTTALHIQDTLKAGAGLCDPAAVEFLVEHAASCIHHLVEMGVAFDRQGEDLALTLEAAHSRRRVLHAADTTGRAVVTTLTEQVLSRSNIQVLSQAFVLELWLEGGQCQGVSLFFQGAIHWLRAPVVILATGGGGQVFAQTTNPAVSTGDGVAIAHRAGALLRDLEFVQFHPTALTQPGAPRFLISEAVRGEGAHLVDDQGRRFAFDYHADGELAPRDVVSRAIFQHLQKTAADPATAKVWLDLRSLPLDTLKHRFPNIIQVCQRWGVDPVQEPIPVAPAAHYWMGGIVSDRQNQTSIPGLYAVGETASTGVHGANRLASNSLLECLVFGAQFRSLQWDRKFCDSTAESYDRSQVMASRSAPITLAADELEVITFLRAALPRLMWQSAGICREQSQLETAIGQVAQWQEKFAQLPVSQRLLNLAVAQPVDCDLPAEHLRAWGELHNLLDIAQLILKSAHFRTESRGGHYRSDYPETLAAWQRPTIVQADRCRKG